MYTATKLVEYARSLADLENSQFISYDDEKNLLNEAWRDLYSLYTETSGDYWTEEVVIQLTSADVAPNSLNGKEYLVNLPVDFYKIRLLDWNSGGRWSQVDVFSTSMRGSVPSKPYYRLKNNKLWIISPIACELRLTYYIPPAIITLPNFSKPFLESTPIYDLSNIGLGQIIDNKLIYTDTGSIYVENKDTGDVIQLYNSIDTQTQVQYYAGYIYWIEDGAINRAPTNFTQTLIPTEIIADADNFLLQDGYIYYSFTDTYKCNLDGSSPVLLLPEQTTSYQIYLDTPLYINSAGTIVVDGEDSTIDAERVLQYDGVIYYYIDNTLYSLDDNFNMNILDLGYISKDSYLPIRTDDSIIGKSLIIDTVFDYPTNEVNELMAYLCGLGFARKQSNTVKMELIGQRLGALMARFSEVVKRDEYQFYRINNNISTPPIWY